LVSHKLVFPAELEAVDYSYSNQLTGVIQALPQKSRLNSKGCLKDSNNQNDQVNYDTSKREDDHVLSKRRIEVGDWHEEFSSKAGKNSLLNRGIIAL